MSRLTSFLLLLLGAGFVSALETEPKISQLMRTQWTRNQGLPSDNVTAVLQDDSGYLWVGTYEGLVRFNGADFKLYTPATVPGFPLKSARVLALTPQGLAVGSNGEGVALVQGTTWRHFGPSLGATQVRALVWSSFDQSLYVGTTNGLYRWAKETLTKVEFPSGLGAGTVECLYVEPSGRLWVSFDRPGALWTILPGGRPETFQAPWTATAILKSMVVTAPGVPVFGTRDQGVFSLEEGLWVSWAETRGLKEKKINRIMEDRTGRIWIASDGGLYRWFQGALEPFRETDGLSSNLIEALWEDRESNLWLGSSRGGLTKLSPTKFHFYTPRQGLPDIVVNAVLELPDQNLVLIGTDKGIGVLGPSGEAVAHPLGTFTQGERIRHLFRDREGKIWIGTYDERGVLVWDGKSLQSYGKASGLSGTRIRQIFQDADGGMWVATTSGLNRRTSQGWKVYDQNFGLNNHYILGVTQDSSGLIWMGTDGGGIYSLDPQTERLTHFGLEDGLPGLVVFKILPRPNGSLVAVLNGGLAVYRQGEWTPWKDGLPFETYFQALPGEGGLWLTATQGLVWLPDRWFSGRDAPRVFSRADGLVGDITPASWGEGVGDLWLPTLEGAARFDPRSRKNNPVPPPLVVEEVRIDGVLADPKEPLVLKAGSRRLTISYAGLSYQFPSQVRYRTRLEGFERDWSPSTAQRSISYTNLPPGTYRFLLLGANNDGLWTPQPLTLPLRQEPPFWMHWYMVVVEVLLVTFLVLAGFRYYSWRIHLRRKELELLVTARTTELAQEKEKSDHLLRSILPVPIAQRLKAGEKVIADSFTGVTVLFLDIIEFTPLAATMPAQDLVTMLGDLFSEFDRLCQDVGVVKIKTTGDAYMAACGVPEPVEDHVGRVCTLALRMKQALRDFNHRSGHDLHGRVGIHTGPVTAGVIGRDRFLYDLWGDTVNVASRLEHSAHRDSIHVSREVKSRAGEKFVYEGPFQVELKGKGVWETWNLLEATGIPRGTP